MHEISLVRNIFKTLEAEFPEKMHTLRRVQLKAGLLSNVQPILMESAWQAVLESDPSLQSISLDVQVLPILIHCNACGTTSEVLQYRFICPCGQPSKDIIQGEELLISEVEFENN